jgi:hypothetical protein
MDWLTTREWAVLVWTLGAFAWALTNAEIRSSMKSVIRYFVAWQVQVIFWLLVAYTAAVVAALSQLSLWDAGELKTTMIWLVAVGLATLFKLPQIREKTHFFREWALDNLKLIGVLEFVLTFYTFDLWVELIFQPFLFLVVGMLAFAPREPRYDLVKKVLNGVLSLIGVGILIFAVYKLITDFATFASWSTLEDFYVPIVLSFAALPFFFGLHVYMTYERVFGTLQFWIKDPALRRRAKWTAVLAFGPRTGLVERWHRYIGAHRPKTASDLKRAIGDVLDAKRRERQPTPVPHDRGWSPAAARSFLAADGLETKDYHRLYDEWLASSDYLKLGDSVLDNNLAYYIRGDELVVTELELVLNVNEPVNGAEAERVFVEKAAKLVELAMPHSGVAVGVKPMEITFGPWRLRVQHQEWQGGIRGGYEIVLTVDIPREQIPVSSEGLLVPATPLSQA